MNDCMEPEQMTCMKQWHFLLVNRTLLSYSMLTESLLG